MERKRYETSNNAFYHSKAWRTLRREALQRDNYLCQECLKKGKITPAKTVHHIKPLRTDKKDALSLDNLETVCNACHNELHPERAFSLTKKKRRLASAKNKGVWIFGRNREVY